MKLQPKTFCQGILQNNVISLNSKVSSYTFDKIIL